MSVISILHPSRSRPLKSFQAMTSWFNKCANPENIEIIVSIDNSDPQKAKYHQTYADVPFTKLFRRENKSSVEAINTAAELSNGDILMVVSDDTEAPDGWDAQILKAVEGKKDWILKTQDGIQAWIITMPVMDRTYYERFGYIYHPDYLHLFADTELSCVADITGRKLKSTLSFPHKHYSVTKESPDEVNNKADSTWAQGEKLFIERYKRNFDLPPGKPIEDVFMVNWIKQKSK